MVCGLPLGNRESDINRPGSFRLAVVFDLSVVWRLVETQYIVLRLIFVLTSPELFSFSLSSLESNKRLQEHGLFLTRNMCPSYERTSPSK